MYSCNNVGLFCMGWWGHNAGGSHLHDLTPTKMLLSSELRSKSAKQEFENQLGQWVRPSLHHSFALIWKSVTFSLISHDFQTLNS